jgi:hypothetical protein
MEVESLAFIYKLLVRKHALVIVGVVACMPSPILCLCVTTDHVM